MASRSAVPHQFVKKQCHQPLNEPDLATAKSTRHCSAVTPPLTRKHRNFDHPGRGSMQPIGFRGQHLPLQGWGHRRGNRYPHTHHLDMTGCNSRLPLEFWISAKFPTKNTTSRAMNFRVNSTEVMMQLRGSINIIRINFVFSMNMQISHRRKLNLDLHVCWKKV